MLGLMRHSICCSEETCPGLLSVRAVEEPMHIPGAVSPDHDSAMGREIAANFEVHGACPDTLPGTSASNQGTLDREHHSLEGNSSGPSVGSLQRTPPNMWCPSVHAPGAPRKIRPEGMRPRRPMPYEERVARHERRQVDDDYVNLDDQPGALMSFFGDARVRAMVGLPSTGSRSFITEFEEEANGQEWTLSDTDDC